MNSTDFFARTLQLGALHGATLAQVDAAAALQHRTDRKYLLPLESAQNLIVHLAPTHHVLDIAGRRLTGYRTLYFDTPQLSAWRAHVQGRRRRWKVRTRLYTEDGLCRMEVKTKDGRGATTKHACRLRPEDYGRMDQAAAAFVDNVLHNAGIAVTAATLIPAEEIRYTRAALADLEAGTRVTLDYDLTCHGHTAAAVLDRGFVLVETKGGPCPSRADRLLFRSGIRPVSLSKYITGQTLLTPGLPHSAVRRDLRDRFHVATYTNP